MELRTMAELETDIIRNTIADKARLCRLAVEAGHASDAAAFARGAVRAARQLGEQNANEQQAERVAEPMLRLATAEEPALALARQLVAAGEGGRLRDELESYDRMTRIVERSGGEQLAGRNVTYWRASSLAFIRAEMAKRDQNAAATVRWSNGDYADAAKAAGGVLVITKEAA